MRTYNLHRIRSLSRDDGFTLVEMMMTLLIFGVVLGVISNVFFTTQGMYSRTSTRAAQQMSSRAGMTVMVEEIRHAGADPENTGLSGLMSATIDTVRIRAELNDTPGIQTAEPSEDVTYFWDDTAMIIMRDNGTGPQPMIENVTDFQLTYFDVNNQLLGPLPLTPQLSRQVRSVGITVTTDTNQGGEMVTGTRIGLRNNN